MKSVYKLLLISALVALTTLTAVIVYAFSGQNDVGRVSVNSKSVHVLRNGMKKKVGSFGMLLELNDVVVTGPTGKAQVLLADDSQIVVGAKTRLKITKGVIKDSGLSVKRFILGLIGKMRAQVRKSSGTSFRVKTATATIGVKGTDFVVEYANGETTVGTLEGLVNMKSNLNDQELDIPPGKMSSVSSSGEVMSLTDIAGSLLSGVEIAGEQMSEEEISGEKVK